MKARGTMKKSKDRGIFSSVISYICPQPTILPPVGVCARNQCVLEVVCWGVSDRNFDKFHVFLLILKNQGLKFYFYSTNYILFNFFSYVPQGVYVYLIPNFCLLPLPMFSFDLFCCILLSCWFQFGLRAVLMFKMHGVSLLK